MVLILVGGGLIIIGLAIACSGRNEPVRVGNTGFSFFGSVKQTFSSIGMTINGTRRGTTRDWIGWGLSACGLLVGLIGLLGP